MAEQWVKKIVGNADVPPGELVAHDRNWRQHPAMQRDALLGAIGEIGFIRSVTVNQRTGRIIDGHLRVKLALETEQPTIPVEYVDLSEEEEKKALLTLDPLTELATANKDALDTLLREVQTGDQALAGLLNQLAADNDILLDEVGSEEEGERSPAAIPEQFNVLVVCNNEQEQAQLLAHLTEAGYKCRSLIS